MVKIRLTRTGRKNLPSYRIVAVNAREKRESKFLDFLGFFSPISKQTEIKKDRVEYWLSVGAKPTETVENLLRKVGILPSKKQKKTFNKTPGKKSQERKKTKE